MANVILDTGPLVALFKDDRHHAAAVAWFRNNKQRLITTLPVLWSADWDFSRFTALDTREPVVG